ncbi:MAG TPA: DUF4175 family protein [Gemmatimonadales bacterium]|nr:DUF4175 family protein [Gemmatimonadales bacterium]
MSGSERALHDAVRRLRRGWRSRVLLEGTVKLAGAVLLALLLGAGLTALFGASSNAVVVVRVAGYALIATALLRYLVLPALQRPDDARLALYAEERAPELKQALLSAVHELRTPEEARPSPALAARVVEEALAEVRRLEAGPGLERPRVRRAAGVLGLLAATAAFLLLAGPQILRDTARVLFIPWAEAAAAPAFSIEVTPGNASVPKGGALEVRARLHGFAAEAAELVLRADTGSDWVRLPMLKDSAAAQFTTRLFDLVRATEYFVEADGIKSPAFQLTVSNLPAVQRLSLELRFPAYTGLAPEKLDPGGDVAAVVGTTVTVRASVTLPAKSAVLRVEGGPSVPLAPGPDGRWSGSFAVKRDGFYRVDLVAPDGTSVPGSVQYVIEALEDHVPSVKIEQPGRDTKVTSVEEVSIALRASDDYGVIGLELRYSVNGGAEQRVALTDSAARRNAVDVRAAHTLFLEELGLTPGDLIAYHAVARDGAGGSGSSDIYFLEVRPFGRDYEQADASGSGSGSDSPEGLSARQRQVVAGTFNWLRDSAKTAERQRREDLTTLAIAQGKLKQDVIGLVRRLMERGIASADTSFALIHAELDTASREMEKAEENLGKGIPSEALPAEQRALQRLQRAEAVYREVQVQLGSSGQGSGGGGSNVRAEDLADLFSLETDKLQNQYESVQREQTQSASQQIDAAAERLRQLASRQQQENERMQRMMEELRSRSGSSSSSGQGGSGGGGSAQRELARQAEEEARRLERLAREQNQPQLAEAARQLQEAADAMRRAASGTPSGSAQGGNALERLRKATRELENSRSARQSESIRGLQQRAEEMKARQQDIAQGVEALPQAGETERAERLRRLDEKKDALANEVEKLQADAERTAREARSEQPGAAGKVAQAAETIQQARIHDRVLYSKDVMRGNSPEYAKRFEAQISENLGNVAERLREAAGALSESAEGKQDRVLQRARELVKGLESLRERVQDASGAGQQESGSGGNSGRGQANGGQANGSLIGGGGKGRVDPEAARQFGREFRLRREAAESLRRELAQQGGVDLSELDRAIGELRQLESGRRFGDPRGIEELQAAVIEGLKTWEFKLFRALTQSGANRPALGAPSQVPPEYRALVEEYYRSLGRGKKPAGHPVQQPVP